MENSEWGMASGPEAVGARRAVPHHPAVRPCCKWERGVAEGRWQCCRVAPNGGTMACAPILGVANTGAMGRGSISTSHMEFALRCRERRGWQIERATILAVRILPADLQVQASLCGALFRQPMGGGGQ
ncbi:MAG: hypothetical protein KatS3mg077_2046 [Candidatus Binatia bacterium]|nr:MAG: hypothetical protein KatS3mg077_2046 [Candidatus Binatia bacterium]